MSSNYNLMNNNNDNKNNGTFNLYDNGLHYAINGLRLINPNLSAISPPNFPKPRLRPFKLQTLQRSNGTAVTMAAESARFNNIFFEPQPFHGCQGRGCNFCGQNQNHQPSVTQPHHQLFAKKSPRRSQKVHSPPPTVHQCINQVCHSRHNHHHNQQQEEFLTEQRRHKLSRPSSKSFSAYQQHYQHYYSYHYNYKPHLQAEREKCRKVDNAMATSKGDIVVEDAFPNFHQVNNAKLASYNYLGSPSGTGPAENNRSLEHHVLKEKMPNNNIINYVEISNAEWAVNDGEIVSDFLDVQEMDKYDQELNFGHVKPRNTKRKERIQAGLEAPDLSYNLAQNERRIDNNVSNAAHCETNKLSGPVWDDSPQRVKNKLPETPKKGSKKQSPPAHRVLLYNNNSPRLTRLSPSTLRLQEARRRHNNSPLPITKDKRVEFVSKNVDAVNVFKAIPPIEANILKSTPKGEHEGINGIKDVTIDDADDVLSNNDDDYYDLDNVSEYGKDDSSDTTSDSEDGYRTHVYKLTHPLDRTISKESYLPSESSEDSLENPDCLLVPSLFPNVPPYLAFSSNTCKGPDVPPELHRVLKWRVSNVMPKVVRYVLTNSGMRLVKKTNDWIGVWGKHMKSPCFKTIRPYQKINHLPGSFKIGRKDACWRNLQKQMNKHGKKDFGFMPKTYIIPRDLNVLRKHWPKYAQRNVKWIIKPPASARGAGIRVVDRWAQIPKRKPLIVQKYIERPLLINGSKFDLRLYVLVTSINPLRVFMYHNGLARFASVKYSDKSDTLNDRCMHLTNYSINKFSSNYSKNEDVNACHGHKWTIKSLWSYLANRGIRTDFLWEALRNLVLRTIMAGEQSINNMLKLNVESKYSCFELFGFDVLLDADLIPWLLEVNISPSLHSELPLDAHVKAPLVQAVLNTALYNVPPKLSLEKQKEICAEMSIPPGPICYDKRLYINYLSRTEKIKHNTYTRKTMEDRDEYINSILDNLTPDDVRCLIVAEDELSRSTPLERIFPTNQTYKYLKYNDTPRYYNRLLDAWETRYSNNRAEGIALLREYCEEKYHFQVPPSPAKKQLKYRARAMIVTRRLGLTLRFVPNALQRRAMYRVPNRKPRPLESIEIKSDIAEMTVLETETP